MSKLHIVRIQKSGGIPLEQKDFRLNGTVEDPALLYPTAEISSLPSLERDIVSNLYSYGRRINEYAGVISEWDASVDKNVWGASIDTIVLIKALLENNIFSPNIRSVSELGTGAGMVLKAAVMHCPGLKEVFASDIVEKAIQCMLRNVTPIIRDIPLQGIVGPGIRVFKKVDLLLVNPPYLPEKESSGEVDQYRGLDLIHEVLREGKDHLNPGGKVIINYSSCAEKEFKLWAKEYGWKVKPLLRMEVPLKINRVSEDPTWLEFMLEHGGLNVRDEDKTGYRYWHVLNVVQLTPA